MCRFSIKDSNFAPDLHKTKQMIKTIIFDFGGVIITLSPDEAVRRFKAIGLTDADRQLDKYTQGGIFGAVEEGKITDEEFREQISAMVGKELTWDECQWCWLGYRADVPRRNVEMLKRLRREGYRLVMLSNTNPYMMKWAMSNDFSRGLDEDAMDGRPASDYFDAVYKSYEVGAMKPDARFFTHVLEHEHLDPAETIFVDDGAKNIEAAANLGMHTLLAVDGEDWRDALMEKIKNIK